MVGRGHWQSLKRNSLNYWPPFTVMHNNGNENAGWTYIIKKSHALLCKRNFTNGTEPVARPSMTHNDVIDIFKRGLAMDWPKDNDGLRTT